MAHDRAAAVTASTARSGPPLLVARNLLPSSASSSSVSASTTSVMSSSSSSSVATMGARSARRRDRKYVGDATVTSTSSSTLSTASSVDVSSTATTEAARRARRHTHHSQPDHDPKRDRRRGASSPHRHHSNSQHRRPRSRDAGPGDSMVSDANADIGPEKFASKVLARTHTKSVASMESPPASPDHYSSSSSGGQGSDKEEMVGQADKQRQQVAMKPSRMVVKRRATAPASSNSAHRPSTGPTPVPSSPARQPSRSVGKPGTTNSPRVGAGSPPVGAASPGRSTSSLERWQIRLQRTASGNSSGTDDERHGREPSSSRGLYSNHRSRQLMESPPPPDQAAATSRTRGSDSPSVDQARTRARSTSRGSRQASPGGSGGLPPPPPPLSLSTDGQGSTTPRTLARKVPQFDDDATEEGDDDSTPKPRPVRIRYETPERGMGGKREISHASLGKLIARLTDAHQYDTEFRDVFLLTYRSFCSPYDFIKKLLKRYTAVLSLCGNVDPKTIEETQRLLDQITLEEENEQRSSNLTSISTAKSDINTGMEANVSIMRLLSVLKFWIKESGFIDQDLMNDRKAQKKLMAFLSEIQNTSPIPSIRRHAENLLRTVAQLQSVQKQAQQAQAQAQTKAQSQRGPAKVPPPPALVTSSSTSAVPDFSRPGGDVVQDPQSAVALAMAHQLSDLGASHVRMRAQAATKLSLPRSSSDPKRERSMVKLRTKNSNGDIFQLRSRSIPTGADDQAVAAAATRDRMLRNGAQHVAVPSAAAVAPKIARGITTGSAEAAIKANANDTGAGGFDEIIQDTLQRARLTAASRKSARISYDNVEPLSGLSAQELADQLTLMEADQYFSKLNPRELTNKAWTRENKHREAPHVMALIELFDATAEWVSSEILHPQLQAVERAKMITLFIDAADNCYQMNNFNTLFEITTGLSAPCIRQLNTTWSLVTAAALEKYQCLQQVCSPDDNYRSYRQAFALAEGQPRLSCWFILVKDLFTYEEAMKSMEDGLVNWQKFRRIYRVISESLDRQNFNYVPPNAGTSAGSNGASTGGVSRKGRGILRHDRKNQIHIRHRIDTIRKDSSVLYQLARNANTQESILFVNSLSEAGFL
ncbi:RasGEF domain [Phytophthora infestans]|uniref:RasGEF domain n=1 Tax=Phytophthora infestans TaxID=4787 RepID=A0A833SP30_PHYIN|nr:RasGEF domain [Phytophthora infestans]